MTDVLEWMGVLRREVEASTFRQVAERVGYSATVLNQVLMGHYTGRVDRVRDAIECNLMGLPADFPESLPYAQVRPCPFCDEQKQMQHIRIDFKNPGRDIIQCRVCGGKACRDVWQMRGGQTEVTG